MYRFLSLFSDSRTLALIGIAALALFLLLGAQTLEIALTWGLIAVGVVLAVWLAVWLWRRRKARKAAEAIGEMLEDQAEKAARDGDKLARAELETLRNRMQEAVRTIKSSKLGQLSGKAALYELPWYITIGNPAAGKSSAIVNSGLKFPFEDGAGNVVHGIGGTRNCDWFFTTEGILLDTAGRYAINAEDRSEWLGFLDLLKKHRPRAPINGIIVTVSIAELVGNTPDFAIALAKNLRQRVQELTERLEVLAPVYLMFTKADLITGFNDFFQDIDWSERDRVWGATLPYDTAARHDTIALFERRFDELYEGLREMSVAQLALARGDNATPGLLAFPLEFAAIKPVLRSFVATLFEDNPFQFRPVFRGFYITSALQSGESRSVSSDEIEQRFGLTGAAGAPCRMGSSNGFFLKDLFSRVIFADRNLIRQHTSPLKTRLRYAGFMATVLAFGIALGGWSWSYTNNRALVANVQADFDQVVRMQEGRLDLQSRLQALDILQDRITQLEQYRRARPLQVGFGLFQGDELLASLKANYFSGVRAVMLDPVTENLEAFLAEVARTPLQAQGDGDATPRSAAAPGQYRDARADSVEDAYNALKTYLMLASAERIEPGHLSDQLTRFWRTWLEANRGNMNREEMIRRAERLLSFHLSQVGDPQWPLIRNNLALVDGSRDNLRRVVRGMPAAERVYAEVKARASTRFPPVTVASIVGPQGGNVISGSHVVSGAFTVEAWRTLVQPSIREAATSALDSTDWVLRTAIRDDLTLEGSPEQIQKTLIDLYKREYADEWRRFVQGIDVAGFDDFGSALNAMNHLGNVQQSPIGKILRTVFEQTSWDNPARRNAAANAAGRGFVEWFKRAVLRISPSNAQVDLDLGSEGGTEALGVLGREFAGIARLMAEREDGASLAHAYLQQLALVRTRLNELNHQGDPGPGAVKLMQDTLEGRNSELSDALRFVEEQMLAALPDDQRATLRPLLLRPLQQSFAAALLPAQRELNKTWLAQVYEPFSRQLGVKYPFAAEAGIEATPGEIAQIFGPEGAIARFVDTSMGALVVRRGDTISARTWGDLGLTLEVDFMAGFSHWVRALDGAAAGGAGDGGPQTAFMLMPHPAAGTTEYVIEIDGQQLRYRNNAAQWANFIWPNPGATPGARIVATTFDGRQVEVVNFSGRFGLEKLINSAQRQRKPDGAFQMSWSTDGITVSADLRIISSTQAQSGDSRRRGFTGLRLPESIVRSAPPATTLAAAGTRGDAPR